MFCTKFKLSADRIQILKVITGLGFTLHHWHKPVCGSIVWKTDLQKSIDFLLNPFFVFGNDLYVNLLYYM